MNKFNLLLISLVSLLTSCGGGQLYQQIVYETNPHYSWGYAEYYGAYYKPENGNKNNVLSVSLFTDSLKINAVGNLTGLGQYLFLEDVFQSPKSVFLEAGTYIVNNSGLPFTITPGKNDTVDGAVYPIGAYISYYEYNAANSTLKTISKGSMTVSFINDSVYNIVCDFKTSDSTLLKGSFSATLPHIDQSLSSNISGIRKKLVYIRK